MSIFAIAFVAALGAVTPSPAAAPEVTPAPTAVERPPLEIPSWFGAKLYPRPALENLYARFDLTPLKTAPSLVWRTEPAKKVFQLDVERGGRPESYPVVAINKGAERNEYLLTVLGPSGERQAVVTLAGNSTSPAETVLSGFDEALDGNYTPAMRVEEGRLRIFASAEDELAVYGLAGAWTGPKAENMSVTIVTTLPFLIQIGKYRYRVEIGSAPAGIDALAVPAGAGSPLGFHLFGPNVLERLPVRCTGKSADRECRASGPPEKFHRIGARLNAR